RQGAQNATGRVGRDGWRGQGVSEAVRGACEWRRGGDAHVHDAVADERPARRAARATGVRLGLAQVVAAVTVEEVAVVALLGPLEDAVATGLRRHGLLLVDLLRQVLRRADRRVDRAAR